MKTALCIIVEGDSKLNDLKIAIESAAPYVDEVCITTNGKEVKETKKYLKRNGYKHSHLGWGEDFSAQRNHNFSMVSPDTDFILWLDSDDQLIGGEHLKGVLKIMESRKLDQMFLTYWYGCKFSTQERTLSDLEDIQLFHQRERILRVNRIKWVGRIHETPVPLEGIDPKYSHIIHTLEDPHKLFPIAVLHRDATLDNEERNLQRNQRNMKLLESQLDDEINAGEPDPRTVLYLMKLYAESDEKEVLLKCIMLGEKYLETSGWNEERATCYILLADCFGKLGEYERAKQMLLGAVSEYPNNKTIYLKLAQVSFDLKLYKDMKFYMSMAENVDIDYSTAGNRNVFNDKFITEMLKLKYYFNVEKNIDKAYEASKKIYEMQRFDENENTMLQLEDMKKFNDASRNIDHFIKYLAEAKMYKDISNILEVFPNKFRELPFYSRLRNKYTRGRVWGDKEICYFANFNGEHFEKWDPTSLSSGLGGSETAVIKLANEWTKLGYKVTVFGDPKKEGIYDGVTYLSWRRFNPKDRFNIFIQWRSDFMAERITSKKFYVDLHDVWNEKPYLEHLDQIDKIFVKSEFHRNLAPNIPDDKFVIISNGI